MRLRFHQLIAALAALAAACAPAPTDIRPPNRLAATTPTAAAAPLFDRDTTTACAISAPVEVKVTFEAEVKVRALKVFGASNVQVSWAGVLDDEALSSGGERWVETPLPEPVPARELVLRFVPTGADARLGELELWGLGRPLAPRDPAEVAIQTKTQPAAFEDVRTFATAPAGGLLFPEGSASGSSCAQFSVPVDPNLLPQVRRALLVSEATGLARGFELSRSLNGELPTNGGWLNASASMEATIWDELDPTLLKAKNLLTLCVPPTGGHPVALRSPRLVLLLDNGRALLDGFSQSLIGAAADGDGKTTAALPGGELPLELARPAQLDKGWLLLDSPAHFALAARVTPVSDWAAAGDHDLTAGRHALPELTPVVSDLRVNLRSARPEAPAASVAELDLPGSPVGSRVSVPRLVLTSPLPRLTSSGFIGERFGDFAYVAGWAESPAGPGLVEIEGAKVSDARGAFSEPLTRPMGLTGPWTVQISARFPDGSTQVRVLVLEDDRASELLGQSPSDGAAGGPPDARFGAENETSWGRADASAGGVVKLGSEVELDVPAGAVLGATSLGITRKGEDATPPLDPGMINVTAPRNAGYRFSPRGMKFQRPVQVRLPYDEHLLPEGMTPASIKTYFYSEAAERWVPLDRVEVARDRRQVVSQTDHFTFMINAVLVMPEHPGPTAFDPTSIKKLEAAEPDEGIDMIGAPQANNTGSARLSFPFRLPTARGAYTPELALNYDSSGGNGYAGVGWDLSVSAVKIDTRFGAPFYDGEERYVLDGESLVPQLLSLPCADGTTGRRYIARREASFRRILRCGAGTESYRFEVTDKGGTLFVYGTSDGARLASYGPGPRNVAEWRLERVVDVNGNLTELDYFTDKRGLQPGPFESAQGEDFRQLYPIRIRYTGRAARVGSGALSGGTSGIYEVEMLPESDPDGNLRRGDVITEGRYGFKVVTRLRLGTVRVWAHLPAPEGQSLVREYRLRYVPGDFGKSLLSRVEVWGLGGVTGGHLFYAHDLDYTRSETLSPFGTQTKAWRFVTAGGGQALDDRAMTSSADFSVGAHVYVGIGPFAVKESGSAGIRLGFTHREGHTEASFLDVNGDGLPDRVTPFGLALNAGPQQSLSPAAPPGDPYSGVPVFGVGAATGLKGLGSEDGNSFNIAAQATYGVFSANLGYTFTQTSSREFMADADGDGLVDYVGPGEVLFNQQRSATCTDPSQCCPAGQFCFRPDKAVPVPPALVGTGNLIGGSDADLMKSEVESNFQPTDALYQWTAPYPGSVDVSGVLAWVTQHPADDPKRDGARLRIYRESQLLLEQLKTYPDNGTTSVSLTSVAVQPGQRLYFLVSTRQDFPVDQPAGGAAVPLEEVNFHPTIRYTSCSGPCGAISAAEVDRRDATGAKLFVFDAQQDFKIAGDAMSAILVPRRGTIRITWTFDKAAATSDGVRLCLQRWAITDTVAERRCSSADVMRRNYAWNALAGSEALTLDLAAQAGDQLVFRVESDLAVDPAAFSSAIHGQMIQVCNGNTCAPPSDDFPVPSFEADAYVALHDRLDAAVPLRPFVTPRAGKLVVQSSNSGVSGPPFGPPAGTVYFSARSATRQLLKHTQNQSQNIRVDVAAGEEILFEAHSETFWSGTWTLNVGMERADSDGGTVVDWFSAPQHRTYERSGTLVAQAVAGASPLGGGFHGWRYGLWGGADEPFDPAIFSVRPSPPGGTDQEKEDESLDRLEDPNSDERRIARLYAPLLPRRLGTHVGVALGLKPDVPAFVSQDGNTFITATTAHGGRKGGFAQSSQGSASVSAAFDVGDMMRSSINHTVSGGLGLSFLSLSLSGGTTQQKVDVVDLNGDRIVDVANQDGVRVTNLHTLGVRQQVPASSLLKNTVELSGNAGLGISDAIRQLSPKGATRGMSGMFPSIGGGIGVNLTATANDLTDINGDGLPDQVRRDGDSFKVRLNLGNRFAADEDDLPVGLWHEDGVFDQFVQDVVSSGILGGSGGRSKTAESRSKMANAVQMLATADAVNRHTAVTLQANAGVMLNESFGVSANWETSLGATGVALVDVTGDGLPDYVRKTSHDGKMRVKVNRGYAFDPVERDWNLPAWPANTDPAFVLGLFSLLDQADTVKSVLPKVLGPYKADAVDSTGSHSALPSVGFVVTIPIPLSPIMTPWLHLSGGMDVAPRKVSGFELGFQDIDGDGLADHVLKTERGGSTSEVRAQAVHARINQLGGGNLLRRVDRPLGGRLDLEYARTRNSVEHPHTLFVLTKVTVTDGMGTGTGHALVTRFEYEGGHYDRAERDFLGFRTVREIRADGTTRSMTFRNDRVENKGLLEREEVRDANGRMFSAQLNQYGAPRLAGGPTAECAATTPFFLSVAAYCSSLFVPLTATEHRFYEGTTTDADAPVLSSVQRMEYDGLGNVTVFEELGDPSDTADDHFATMTYLSGGTADALHLADRVERIVVREGTASGATGAIIRERVAEYGDGRGNMTRLSSALGDGRWAVNDLAWNSDGTLRRVDGPENETGQRYFIEYEYDAAASTYLVKTTDAFGYSSSGVPDLRFGGYVRTVDLNGNAIVRGSDEFGRAAWVQAPADADTVRHTTDIDYHLDSVPARARTVNHMPDGEGGLTGVTSVVAMDGLGRTVQTKRTVDALGFGIGMSVSGGQVFDVMGRVAQQGQTTFSPAIDASWVDNPVVHPTTFEYDVLDRETLQIDPDGSQTRTNYSFGMPAGQGPTRLRTETIDAKNNSTATYRDVFDRSVATEERIQGRALVTRYVFAASGDLVRIVDAGGNVTSFEYDLLGRRTRQDAPDTGITEMELDPAGNLVRKTTPNLRAVGQSIHFEYEFNRMRRIDHPFSTDITYTYGAPDAGGNGRNRLVHVEDEAGSEDLTYGQLGEVTRSVRVLRPLKPGDGPRRFETQFRFDSFGRMLEMTYPDGERLAYRYDAGGLLRGATGFRTGEQELYLAELRYNLFGQKAMIRLGNGVVSTYQYDPLTLQLRTARTVTPGLPGRTLQQISYEYDAVGNVTSMVNALGPPVGDQSGEVRYAFKYDDLYRLTEARGSALARQHTVDRFQARWDYSDIHNMTRSLLQRELVRSLSTTPEFDHPLRDNRDETYVYGGAGPHQATKVGDTTIQYDANGNMLARCRAFPGETCDVLGPPNAGDVDVSRRHLVRYQWNEENWLSAAVENGQHATRFIYDAGGNRLAKLGTGGASVTVGQFFAVKGRSHATKHIFAGSDRIATKLLAVPDGDIGIELGGGPPPSGGGSDLPGCIPSDTQPNKCDSPVSGPVVIDGPERVRPGTFYYHPTHLGSTEWVTDANAKVHEHVEYYPYGEVWRSPRSDSDGSPTHTQAFLFSSKERDEETGLSYFGARYYDARLARWISPDPAWDAQGAPGLNVYNYVAWNPTNKVDPDGRILETAWDVASFGMGIYSISQWDKNTSTWSKVLDVGGLVLDGAAIVTPFVPGGAGAALKAARLGSKADKVIDGLRGADKGLDTAKALAKTEKTVEAVKTTEKLAETAKDLEKAKDVTKTTASKVGSLEKPPRGPGKVAEGQRDPKRVWTPKERAAKREAQGGQCATGCGKKIDASNSRGHHKERHADGGKTTDANHAEVCVDCHKKLHSPDD